MNNHESAARAAFQGRRTKTTMKKAVDYDVITPLVTSLFSLSFVELFLFHFLFFVLIIIVNVP